MPADANSTQAPASRKGPMVLLSFDVEEFDTPLEYGQKTPLAEQFRVSRDGLDAVLAVLDKHAAPATFFTTANYALHHQAQIQALAPRHELASHGYWHSHLDEGDLAKSKAELERISGKPVYGFRRARMAATDPEPVRAAGYAYNSSENPTWIPGRYNNFFKPRRPWLTASGLLNIPASVTPLVRFPMFWLSFKNFPLWSIKLASRAVLACDPCLNLYFHPWEFAPLDDFAVPGYVKRLAGAPLLDRLDAYIAWLKPRGHLATFREFELSCRANLPK